MSQAQVLCPTSLSQALALRREAAHQEDVRWLAGGQTLLAAMKHGLIQPQCLIDLSEVAELRQVRIAQTLPAKQTLVMGAMTTHAQMASDPLVARFAPGLASMASHIADPQVRQMGTVGGSLANHDPAACWPAAMLALDAKLVSERRTHQADDFFTGLYATALQDDELLTAIEVPRPDFFAYMKIEQPASRFALVGVALARFDDRLRVAVTGMGQGVRRWPEAEVMLLSQALAKTPGTANPPEARQEGLPPPPLPALCWDEQQASADIHASAAYRSHLAGVLLRRLVASMPARQAGPVNSEPAGKPSWLKRFRQIWKPKESS